MSSRKIFLQNHSLTLHRHSQALDLKVLIPPTSQTPLHDFIATLCDVCYPFTHDPHELEPSVRRNRAMAGVCQASIGRQ